MSHLYPLAASAADAIASPEPAARTRYDAEALAGDTSVAGLETEWITPGEDDLQRYDAIVEEGVGAGFIQRYEDASGAPVYAVTYWKLHIAAATPAKPAKAPKKRKSAGSAPESEETDELYFRQGKTKSTRKKRVKSVDPRQLDLFVGPDQQGYEYTDPDNPGVIIADEEGDGTTFGVAPKTRKTKKRTKT